MVHSKGADGSTYGWFRGLEPISASMQLKDGPARDGGLSIVQTVAAPNCTKPLVGFAM